MTAVPEPGGPGQASAGQADEVPELFTRWYCAGWPVTDRVTADAWQYALPAEQQFWRSLDAEHDRLRSECDDHPELADDYGRLRELLDEIGTLAANAPEDDALAVCQDIAMRIAATGVPDDGRHPDGCTCQFCREDEREERDREELDDDTDNTIPDTERGDL